MVAALLWITKVVMWVLQLEADSLVAIVSSSLLLPINPMVTVRMAKAIKDNRINNGKANDWHSEILGQVKILWNSDIEFKIAAA